MYIYIYTYRCIICIYICTRRLYSGGPPYPYNPQSGEGANEYISICTHTCIIHIYIYVMYIYIYTYRYIICIYICIRRLYSSGPPYPHNPHSVEEANEYISICTYTCIIHIYIYIMYIYVYTYRYIIYIYICTRSLYRGGQPYPYNPHP